MMVYLDLQGFYLGTENSVNSLVRTRSADILLAGRRALHWAAVGGHVEALKALKKGGCNMTALTPEGATALHLAADNCNLEAVKWLVKEGDIDPLATDNTKSTAKDLAKIGGYNDIMKYFNDTLPKVRKI